MLVKCAVMAPAIAIWWLLPSPGASRSQQTPTFRASTDLIEVDVNVTDHAGAFVPDLALDDFQILDDGKPRPIEVAYVVRSGRVSIAAHDGASGSLPQVSADAAPPSGRRVMVFFFDTAHMNFGQLRRAGSAAAEFIGKEMNEGDIGGLIIGEKMINDRLTADHAELLRGIQAATLAGEAKSVASATGAGAEDATASQTSPGKSEIAAAEINQQLRDADKAIVSGATAHTEVLSLEMLQRLVDALSRVPGRKNVVFFSAGFPLFGTHASGDTRRPDTLPAMRQVVSDAARSNVHIYSIDVVGLNKGVGSSPILTADDEFSLAGLNARMRGGEPVEEDVLTSLALDTGGLVFFNQNFYFLTLKRIDDDSSNYYVLAFRPDDKARSKKGAFRPLHVSVDRPQLTVRARKGYVVQ